MKNTSTAGVCALLAALSIPWPWALACAAAPTATAFDPAALGPYLPDHPAAQRLRAGDASGAAKLFEEALRKKDWKDAPKARFLLGVALLRERGAEEPALRAAKHFDQLAGKYTLLDPYHALYAARGYLTGKQYAEALARARRVPADSPLDCEARALRGEALQHLNKAAPAIEELRGFLSTCPHRGARYLDARARLAELLQGQGQSAAALEELRALYLEAPTETQGAQAERALRSLSKTPPAFSAAELLQRAMVLFDNMRNPESEAAYRQILERPDLTAQERCAAKFQLAQSVFKQRQRPRAAPLFDDAIAACAPAAARSPATEDLHMKALYQGARCYGSRGELQRAADQFASAEAAHPAHNYADDARLRQAEMYADLAERLQKQGPQKTCQAASCPDYERKLQTLLAELPERYQSGDQRAEALFRLAFRAYRNKDYARAQGHLQDALRRIPRESGWDQEGRTLYWLGRLAELTGDVDAAVGYFQRTAREYPLSYYTLMALNRLRERRPVDFAHLLEELSPQKEPAEPPPWRFAPRPLFGEPAFLRGVELARLGLGPEAKQEFATAGIRVPEGKGVKVASPEQEELLWLATLLYNRAGEWHQSHWIPRHTLTAYQRHYPVGEWSAKWRLAYPLGYADLLTEAARKNGQPEGLQFAIVREESAFDPFIESFANAIGLTQMIPPTAKRFSGGLPTTREALRDPAINVSIGARFLGFLWQTMQGHPALVIAGYNAGENAVFRWLGERGDLDLDAFVEAIPYDETRGYTKRVLSSFLTYNWLQSAPPAPRTGPLPLVDRIPLLSLKLPALPQVKGPKAPAEAGVPEDPHRK